MLTLTSADFRPGDTIPRAFTCEGQDISPAFRWTGVPAGTRELLLVCEDPDAPRGVFRHWAIYGLAPETDGLDQGIPPRFGQQAVNDFGKPGYAGPCPPRGHGEHAYHFRLFALRQPITGARPDATCAEILALARPHVIETAELVGHFGRS